MFERGQADSPFEHCYSEWELQLFGALEWHVFTGHIPSFQTKHIKAIVTNHNLRILLLQLAGNVNVAELIDTQQSINQSIKSWDYSAA